MGSAAAARAVVLVRRDRRHPARHHGVSVSQAVAGRPPPLAVGADRGPRLSALHGVVVLVRRDVLAPGRRSEQSPHPSASGLHARGQFGARRCEPAAVHQRLCGLRRFGRPAAASDRRHAVRQHLGHGARLRRLHGFHVAPDLCDRARHARPAPRQGRPHRGARQIEGAIGEGAEARRSRQPREVRIPRQYEPRIAHAAERHHRLLGDDPFARLRHQRREEHRIRLHHPSVGPPPAGADQRHSRPGQDRGGRSQPEGQRV